MKTMLKILMPFLCIAAFGLSCTKTVNEKVSPHSGEAALTAFEARQPAVANALMNYLTSSSPASARPGAARFIVPFFTVDSWGVMELDPVTNTYASVIFAVTVLDKNDFYRLNNDGTVSVHIHSNEALALYLANSSSPNSVYLSSTDATYTANYSGPVVEFPELGIKFIDLDNGVSRAVSLHGNAKLQRMGQGQFYNLVAKVVQTPSGQTQKEFVLR